MRKTDVPRVPKPRNPVVFSLLKRLSSGAGGRHHNPQRPSRQQREKDLDQRVREIGEW